MGCCYSLSSIEDSQQQTNKKEEEDSLLTKFSFSDLKNATNNFNLENIVSENVDEDSNIVYKGLLRNRGFVAIKILKNIAWPDPGKFVEEAMKVAKLKHKRVVKLIGYCCDGDKRLLVSEFLSNDTLAKRLFHHKSQTVEWEMRLRIAYCIAVALEYCSTSGFGSYSNLSPYKILFDEGGDACISCFGLINDNKDDQVTTGSVNHESVIFRYGTILVSLLSGKQVPPSHANGMIHGKNVIDLMDPNLEGNFSAEEAMVVFKIASRCLRYDDTESLNIKDIVTTLETLQTNTKIPSNALLEMTKHNDVSWTQISSLGEACLRMDLIAIHKILVMKKYEDDKEVVEFSFDEWIQEVKELQDIRKHGDQAFLEQDFETAIGCYSQFIEGRKTVYPSVYARRSLCYLFCNQPDKALRDGMLAQEVFPEWPTAFYLQSLALSKLNMISDSADTLKEAALLETKRHHHEEES
ncbi:unnamed protein product [Cochlearia groenlandica]